MEPRLPDRDTIQNLSDAGCDDETVRCYCELECRRGARPPIRKEQIRLLGKHRKALLGELHDCQERSTVWTTCCTSSRDEQAEEAGERHE